MTEHELNEIYEHIIQMGLWTCFSPDTDVLIDNVKKLIAEVRQARAERDVLIDIQLSHGSCPYTEKHECQKDQHLNDDDIKECWLKWVKNHIIKEVENG